MPQLDEHQGKAIAYFQELQDRICAAIEALDGLAHFQEDRWQRSEGGGGRTRILPEGAVFDISYINKYLNQNRSLLPPEFTRDSVQIVRDCPSASAEVRLPLDVSELASHPLRQSVNCETSEDIPK